LCPPSRWWITSERRSDSCGLRNARRCRAADASSSPSICRPFLVPRSGPGCHLAIQGEATFRTQSFPVQVQIGFPRNQREHLADLLEAVAQQEMRVSPITLGAENVEIRLRRFEYGGATGGGRQAVGAGLFGEGRG